jgi:dienelactone hydrolase
MLITEKPQNTHSPQPFEMQRIVSYYHISSDCKYNTSNIFLGGFSAGGNIAFVIAFIIGSEHVKAVTGFYPGVYLIKQHTAPEKRISAGVISQKYCRIFDVWSSLFRSAHISRPGPDREFPRHIYLVCRNME